jgi:hypothetical protein
MSSLPLDLNARSPVLAVVLAALLSACATTAPRPAAPAAPSTPSAPSTPAQTPAPPDVEPPPPNVNLSGFPLPYRQGYADGCASAAGTERKDAVRFASDGNYRTGWQDGLALCKKK